MTEGEFEKYREFGLSAKIHGTPVSRLDEKKTIEAHDVFMFTKNVVLSTYDSDARILDEYYDGVVLLEDDEGGDDQEPEFLANEELKTVLVSQCSSFGIEYLDLSSSIFNAAKDQVNLGSMAFEDRLDYSELNHNHDDIYTKFQVRDQYVPPDESFWRLMTIHISNFTEDGELVENTVDIVSPSAYVPVISEEEVGTVKFIGVDNLGSKVANYGEHVNVDITQEDFDGWVYPNGTIFPVVPGQFQRACQTYGGGSSTQFTVPDLRHFIRLNPGLQKTDSMQFQDFNNGLPRHQHEVQNLSVGGGKPTNPTMHAGLGGGPSGSFNFFCGYGWPLSATQEPVRFSAEGSFSKSTINGLKSGPSDKSLDVESKPTHNLMPIMVYIGKA